MLCFQYLTLFFSMHLFLLWLYSTVNTLSSLMHPTLIAGISIGSISPLPHLRYESVGLHVPWLTCIWLSGVGTQEQPSWVPGHVRMQFHLVPPDLLCRKANLVQVLPCGTEVWVLISHPPAYPAACSAFWLLEIGQPARYARVYVLSVCNIFSPDLHRALYPSVFI